VHSSIVGSHTFRSQVETKVFVFIWDSAHHCYTGSSGRRDCNSYIVISRLPYAASSLPQMRRSLVKVNDFFPFSVILSALVDEIDPFQKYFLGSVSAGQSFSHASIGYSMLNVKLSQRWYAHLDAIIVKDQLASPKKRVMSPFPHQKLGSKGSNNKWTAQFLSPLEASFFDKFQAVVVLSISHQNGIHWWQFHSDFQSNLLQGIQRFYFSCSMIYAAISKLDDLLYLKWHELYSLSLDIPSKFLLARSESVVFLSLGRWWL